MRFKRIFLFGLPISAAVWICLINKTTALQENSLVKISSPSQMLTVHSSYEKSRAPASSKFSEKQTESSPSLSAEQVLKNDDYCSFQKQLSSDMPKKIQDLVFEKSRFKNQYDDYQRFLRGEKPVEDRYSGLLYVLDQGGLLSHHPKANPRKIPLNQKAALSELGKMDREDPGNAAYAAFAISILGSAPTAERDYWIERLHSATKFQTYYLEHAQELAAIEDSSVVSIVTKIGYMAGLKTADWFQIKDQLKSSLPSHSEDLRLIGELMMKSGLEARQPSWEFSFDILEYSMGRALTGASSAYPNYNEINQRAGSSRDEDTLITMFTNLSKHCSSESVEELRNFLMKLQREKGSFGFSP